MGPYDIETDIQVGRQIFEKLPNDLRPMWSGLVLSCFDDCIKEVPSQIKDLYGIIDYKSNWIKAHDQFNKIRQFHLDNPDFQPEEYLELAEKVAKVAYNASGQPAPFDSDSGWYITSLAFKTTSYFDNKAVRDDVKNTIMLFSRAKRIKNIATANDLLTYKKIDSILWLDWDPIGINTIAPRDEYQIYVPVIYSLLKSNADEEKIAKRLYKIETETIGVTGDLEHCRKIAGLIVNLTK